MLAITTLQIAHLVMNRLALRNSGPLDNSSKRKFKYDISWYWGSAQTYVHTLTGYITIRSTILFIMCQPQHFLTYYVSVTILQ